MCIHWYVDIHLCKESVTKSTISAGIFARDDHVRKSILEFLDSCRQRTGWPVNPLGDELQQLWTAYESPQAGGHMSSLLYLYH